MLPGKRPNVPRWSLRTFLIATAVAGVIAAVWLRPLLVPFARNFSTSVPTGMRSPHRVGLDILWEPGTGRGRLRQVIVYPSGVSIEAADDLRHAPRPKDICLRRTMIFIDGKPWEVKEHPCFLVFDSHSRSFYEIPIRSNVRGVDSVEDVTELPEWRLDVLPVLARVYGQTRK